MPTWIYVAGFIVSAVIIAFVGVVLMLTDATLKQADAARRRGGTRDDS